MAVTPGAAAADRLVACPGRLVDDERGERALVVEHADARREPREPREAFVEPSTGSSTASSGLGRASWRPVSSLSTPRPAPSSTARATSSAARSERYWPARVPARPQSARPRRAAAHRGAAAPSSSSRADAVHGGRGYRCSAGRRPRLHWLRNGRHRRRRVRGRAQGPRRRPRLPRARRAALRRDVLAPPVLGGRPAPRGGLRRPDRPAPRARGRPADAARLRGRRRRAPRRRRPAGQVVRSPSPSTGASRRCRTARTCSASPSTSPASAASTCRSRSRRPTRSARSPTRPSGGCDRRPPAGLARPGARRRGAALRHLRPGARGEPLPPRGSAPPGSASRRGRDRQGSPRCSWRR